MVKAIKELLNFLSRNKERAFDVFADIKRMANALEEISKQLKKILDDTEK